MDKLNITIPNKTDYRIELYHMYLYDYAVHMIYAFQQHIQKSLNHKTGRSVTLWPHGILFRDSEMKMRKKMIESDIVECIIGLGPNLFYNSPMESCLLVTRNNKKEKYKKKYWL